jgi:hypothetical protein
MTVTGDFQVSGAGILTETGSATTSTVTFNKAGVQTCTSGGTLQRNVNFVVNSGSAVQMAAAGTIVGGSNFTWITGSYFRNSVELQELQAQELPEMCRVLAPDRSLQLQIIYIMEVPFKLLETDCQQLFLISQLPTRAEVATIQ